MKRIAVALVFSLAFAGLSSAQMMRDGGMPDMPMGMMAMGEHMGPDLMGACMANLDGLGLPAGTLKALEDKRFELKKKAIRGMAELKVLRLEASRLMESRTFDLKEAEGKFAEISRKEAELHALHLGYLRELGAALTDEQWKSLREKRMENMPMGNMMKDGMMRGMMRDGMMMDGMKGKPDQSAPSEHHPANKEEAGKFFEEKK